jgi:GNAT superfamily N-acetyltransferase
VLLPSHRGRGIGHAFFDAREAHGRALGRTVSCFCAVIRDAADPRRPPGHAPLDPFWRKRGYAPVEGAEGSYSWRELGAAAETAHPMRMWLRRL